MYTPMMQHRTPNVVEGVALGEISDYIPSGVTQAWSEIKGKVSSIGTSTWMGYVAIGVGALFILSAMGSVSGGGSRRRRR